MPPLSDPHPLSLHSDIMALLPHRGKHLSQHHLADLTLFELAQAAAWLPRSTATSVAVAQVPVNTAAPGASLLLPLSANVALFASK